MPPYTPAPASVLASSSAQPAILARTHIPRSHAPGANWALVPLKASHLAKSRLAEVLGPAQRERLFYALAERVIRSLHGSTRIGGVAVVTCSREVASFARTLGATPIPESTDGGMSLALQSALISLQRVHPARVLMLPGDLPLISAAAIDELLGAADVDRHVVIVPDRHREGTNALLCTPPQVIVPHFGQRSFDRHLAATRAAGVTARIVESDALALDLDCPADLEHLRLHAHAQILKCLDPSPAVAASSSAPFGEFAGALRPSAGGGVGRAT